MLKKHTSFDLECWGNSELIELVLQLESKKLGLNSVDTIKKISSYSDEILDIIDNRDDYTRSDLQGIIEALVAKIIRES
jgi:hypothetical protein